MKSNKGRLVVVLGFAATLPACAGRYAQIRVAGTGEACNVDSVKTIKVKVEVLKVPQAVPAKDDKYAKFVESTKGLAWLVWNQCAKTHEIEVGNFKLNGKPIDPPLVCPMGYSAKPDEGAFGAIACKVRDGVEYGRYKYSVKLDGVVKLDPDVIIKR